MKLKVYSAIIWLIAHTGIIWLKAHRAVINWISIFAIYEKATSPKIQIYPTWYILLQNYLLETFKSNRDCVHIL